MHPRHHGVPTLVIRSLLDRQQFSDPLGLAERMGISSATWPLFGLLWPSGALLAAHMAARVLRPGERILEIGCGLALASLVATGWVPTSRPATATRWARFWAPTCT